MKFKCGLSEEELAKKRELFWAKVQTMENWHDHFAWWPVKVDSGDCRWLETVQRRYKFWTGLIGGIGPHFREKPQ